VIGANAQVWSQKHAEWEQTLWHSGVSCPKHHWCDYIAWIRHSTIDDYRRRKAEYIASGADEADAMHRAADEAGATMERALREVGYGEDDVARMMAALMGAFAQSQEEGQAQWRNTREAVLRRRAAAEQWEHAEKIEAEAVKRYTERRKRSAPIVAEWATQKYATEPNGRIKR
jgi:hypothetical protein